MANLVLGSSILNLPVAALSEGRKVGSIASIIVDYKTGHIIGFKIKSGLFSAPKYCSFDDVKNLSSEGVVIEDSKDIVELKDVVRADKICRKGIKIFGQKVRSQNRYYGKVEDIAVSLEHALLMELHVTSFSRDYIIPRSDIVSITKKEILIKDDREVLKALPEAKAV